MAYHDQVWGRPVADPLDLFAKLCLDGQQAGLSWLTILRKQAGYEAAFAHFDPERIARFHQADIERLMHERAIVRNRLKIESIIRNARGYLELQEEGHEFATWLWQFVEGRPVINHPRSMADIATTSAESQAMSKALKKRGFNFVGPTICYAFMQAVGMINDHFVDCHVRTETVELARRFSL